MRRLYIPLVVFLLVFSFLVGAYLRPSDEVASTSTPKNLGAKVLPIEEPIPGERVSEGEAAARLPYALPRVEYLPVKGDVREIWASPESVPADQRSLAIVFDNDITLIVHQDSMRLNFGALAQPPFQRVQVNGLKGIGTDPGDQQLKNGATWHYPGSVQWQQDNLVLTVYGEFPLEELIKVAESIR